MSTLAGMAELTGANHLPLEERKRVGALVDYVATKFEPLRQALAQLSRRSVLEQPLIIVGLDDELVGYRRRSIDVALSVNVHLRALLARRSLDGTPPSNLIANSPQCTRGPSGRWSISHFRSPAVASGA